MRCVHRPGPCEGRLGCGRSTTAEPLGRPLGPSGPAGLWDGPAGVIEPALGPRRGAGLVLRYSDVVRGVLEVAQADRIVYTKRAG